MTDRFAPSRIAGFAFWVALFHAILHFPLLLLALLGLPLPGMPMVALDPGFLLFEAAEIKVGVFSAVGLVLAHSAVFGLLIGVAICALLRPAAPGRLCEHCGYDLRGRGDDAERRCPECGGLPGRFIA